MTRQIAVRLPDELVEYVDHLARQGAGSRATVWPARCARTEQQLLAEHDARIVDESGDYDDFDALVAHSAISG